MDCPSCGRANASDQVECSYCDALLVDVFHPPAEKPANFEKTDPLLSILGASAMRREEGDDSGSGFTRAPMAVQYTGDLPRLFRFGNRYQILEKLGEGGMGRVYKALDLELDRAVALKTIRAEKGTGPEVLKRFKQELVLARKITHKNVVRIYDLGESEGMKFFTMELVEGQSLRDLLRDKKTVSAKEAISMMNQMLSGLAEAHAQGIVHRDLKPQNIMIDPDGVLRIMDFGIARAADTQSLTGSSEMMGTPDYISPEQVKGDAATAQSDLYAVGVILYELLTGEVPFKGDTAISKVVARLQVKPALPRSLNPEIPSYLERIILKLMEVDPDLRYKTTQDVLQDLEREQVDSSFLLRIRKSLARRRGQIAAACLVGAALVGVWYYRKLPEGAASADIQVTTLAILPFHNMTGNDELQWMENGIPEMLITDISQSRSLRPLLEDRVHRILSDLGKAGQTSFDEQTLEVFSNMARADYILHGRFLESEGRLRIDLTLRESATGVGTPMKLDGKAAEVFGLVDSITERLSTQLDLNSLFERNRPIAEVVTASLDAFRAYQRGIGDLQDGRNQAAISALKEAVVLDAGFPMAHARLAEAYWNLGDSSSAKTSIQTAQTLALEHPLPLPERFQIHAIGARINDDPDTAIDSYRRLAEFFPSDPSVMLGLASALESKGEMEQALETYRAVTESNPTYGAGLLGLGRMLVTVDRSEEAIPFLERAVVSGEFESDLESLGMLHSILGVAYRLTDDQLKALEHFELSLSARRKVGDRRGVIASLVNMAAARRRLKEYDHAAALLTEAVAEATQSRIPSMESFALLNLGILALDTGRPDEALDRYRASLDIELDLKQNNEIAYRLDWIAEVYRRIGLYVEALVYLEQAKIRLEGIDEPWERGFHLRVFADVQKARGQFDEAAQAYLTAIPVLEQSGNVEDLVRARCSLADVYIVQGRFKEALQVIEQGLGYFERRGGVSLAMLKVNYSDFLLEIGERTKAQEQINSVLDLAPELELEDQPYFDYVRGRLLAVQRNVAAIQYLSKAAADAEKKGDLLLSGRASILLGRALVEQGRVEAGRKLIAGTLENARRGRHRELQASAAIALAETEMFIGGLAGTEELLAEAEALANGFDGRFLMMRVHRDFVQAARSRGDLKAAELASDKAGTLHNWLLDNTPSQHAASFRARYKDLNDDVSVEAGMSAPEKED